MREHLFGNGDRTKEVELHQCLVHLDTGLQEQRALTSTTVVNQDINLMCAKQKNVRNFNVIISNYLYKWVILQSKMKKKCFLHSNK